MNCSELNSELVKITDRVCWELLPNGEEKNHEWCAGSVAGEHGKSLKVVMQGTKAGVWADFSTGQSGDLIDLWQECKSLSLPEALKQIKNFLGIKDSKPVFSKAKKKIKKLPEKPNCKKVAGGKVLDWFESRGISQEAITAFKLGTDGDNVIFPFLHGDKLMMYKTRTVGTKNMWANKDAFPSLFGWQAMSDDLRSVIICEGEIDALSFYEHGLNALSVPFGAGVGGKLQWIENEFDNLEKFDAIFLSMDMDEIGQACIQEIIDRLGRHRCFIVELPKKDANECHLAGIQLKPYLERASTIDPDELLGAWTILGDVYEEFYPSPSKDLGLQAPWVKLAGKLHFRPEEMTVWTGLNGHGKTQMLGNCMVEAISQGYKVCIASMEMRESLTLKRMFRQAGGVDLPTQDYILAINEFITEQLWIFRARGNTRAQKILDVFAYARSRYGVQHFVVDSLAKCGFDTDDYNGQKDFVDKLAEFAIEHKAHVHLVCHSKKQQDEFSAPGKMDVKGSGAITDMVDNVISVWRNKKKEKTIEQTSLKGEEVSEELRCRYDALFECLKQRNGDWEGTAALWFDLQSFQYLGTSREQPKRYVNFSLNPNQAV